MGDAECGANASVSIDLESQKIISSDGSETSFEIDAFRKHCLLNGLDDIGLTMEKDAKIDAYEKKMKASQPWL
jgi:3-isopropylmalate/(R)-2-methylmalate dehydratase small subunit